MISAVLGVASLSLAVLPDVGAAAFALLIYGLVSFPTDFSVDAQAYIRLAHAVLGAVMAGWFTMMFWLASLIGTSARAWTALVFSLGMWFVPDTLYSVTSGYWENAVLNVVVLGLILPALVGTHAARAETAPTLAQT